MAHEGHDQRQQHDGVRASSTYGESLAKRKDAARMIPLLPRAGGLPPYSDLRRTEGSRSAVPQDASTHSVPPPPVPTIRILAVADVDLRSAAQLAEFALRDGDGGGNSEEELDGLVNHQTASNGKNNDNSSSVADSGDPSSGPSIAGGRVDMCIACGPFVHHDDDDDEEEEDDDDEEGNDEAQSSALREAAVAQNRETDDDDDDGDYDAYHSRYARHGAAAHERQERRRRHYLRRRRRQWQQSKETLDGEDDEEEEEGDRRQESAADEGTISCTLSQLENIVCRVVYVPGEGDPPSCFGQHSSHYGNWGGRSNRRSSSSRSDGIDDSIPHKQLTPHSRNIHRRWLPLAPGLGCTGLAESPQRSFSSRQDWKEEEDEDSLSKLAHDSALIEDFQQHVRRTMSRSASSRFAHENERHKTLHRSNSGTVSARKGSNNISGTSYSNLSTTSRMATPLKSNYTTSERKNGVQNDDDFGEFLGTLDGLLRLAPSTLLPPVSRLDGDSSSSTQRSRPSQAIAVTSPQPNSRQSRRRRLHGDRQEPSAEADSASPPRAGKWPTQYWDYLSLSRAQENVLLNLAGPAAPRRQQAEPPLEFQIGNVTVVLPGSLRKRGDFAVIDISLAEGGEKSARHATTASSNDCRWKVHRVYFRSMKSSGGSSGKNFPNHARRAVRKM